MKVLAALLLAADQSLIHHKGLNDSYVTQATNLDALSESCLVFIKNQKFWNQFKNTKTQMKISVVFDEKLYHQIKTDIDESIFDHLFLSPNVPLTIAKTSKVFYDEKAKGMQSLVDGRQLGTAKIHPTTEISQNVFIGENVEIEENCKLHPGVVIHPQTKIKKNTEIFSNVTIYPWTEIGENVRIHSNTVIGADGFGYTFHQGIHHKIWHMGGVKIHSHVEIGANSSVDAGTFNPTTIGEGTKIDNFVQVAHNCKIGKGCILCGQSALSGSVVLEDYVVLAGKAGVGPDSHIGMGSQIAGAGLVNEGAIWPAGSKLGGHPARDVKEWMRGFAYVRKMSLKKSEA
jgi:UDP-3-O-[3-hydroxymyristoyl] glucosamine N-acyltransferase